MLPVAAAAKSICWPRTWFRKQGLERIRITAIRSHQSKNETANQGQATLDGLTMLVTMRSNEPPMGRGAAFEQSHQERRYLAGHCTCADDGLQATEWSSEQPE